MLIESDPLIAELSLWNEKKTHLIAYKAPFGAVWALSFAIWSQLGKVYFFRYLVRHICKTYLHEGVVMRPETCVAIRPITRKKWAGMTVIRPITRKFFAR